MTLLNTLFNAISKTLKTPDTCCKTQLDPSVPRPRPLKLTMGARRAPATHPAQNPVPAEAAATLFADLLTGLDRWRIAPDDLPDRTPSCRNTAFPGCRETSCGCMHLPLPAAPIGSLERDVDHLPDKTLKILLRGAKAGQCQARKLSSRLYSPIHFQRKLQLARHLFAVFHGDKLLWPSPPIGRLAAVQGRSIVMRSKPPAERSISTKSYPRPLTVCCNDAPAMPRESTRLQKQSKTVKNNRPKKTGGRLPARLVVSPS
jgi:hypothetical protein